MVGNASWSSLYDHFAFRCHRVVKNFIAMTSIPHRIKAEADQPQALTGLRQVMLVVAAATSLLSALIIFVTSSQPMIISSLVVGLAVFYLGLLLLLRTERARLVGQISLYISWLALSLSAVWLNHGLRSPLLDAYVLVVVMAGLILGSEVVLYKTVRYRKDRSPVDVEIYGVPVVMEERQLGVLVLYQDITERKQAEVLLQNIANHDALTGLPNRMLFFDRLSHAIQKASRAGKKLAVAFPDLDNFKTVNDTFGHGKGDIILKEVAERLKSGVRVSDTIARMGGDDTVIL